MKDAEREWGLKVTGLFIAVKADSDRMVPASGGDGPSVMGALVTEALSAGPAVVLGKLDAELLPAVVAVQDLVVGHPVRRPGRILHQPWGRGKHRWAGHGDRTPWVPRGRRATSDASLAHGPSALTTASRAALFFKIYLRERVRGLERGAGEREPEADPALDLRVPSIA